MSRTARIMVVALMVARAAICDSPAWGEPEHGSSVLSATFIVGGAALAISNATQIRAEGSLVGGLAGIAVGTMGLIYANQALDVRDETAIRVASTAALVAGAAALVRYLQLDRRNRRAMPSVFIDVSGRRHAGIEYRF